MSDGSSPQDSDRFEVPNSWLLISVFLSLIIVPLLEGLIVDRIALRVCFTATIILSATALWRRPVLRIPVLVLGTFAISVAWSALFIQSTPIFVAHCLLGSTFFWFAGGAVLVTAVRQRFATFDSILGAISAYLLFGLAWAFTYWAMDYASPKSFSCATCISPALLNI